MKNVPWKGHAQGQLTRFRISHPVERLTLEFSSFVHRLAMRSLSCDEWVFPKWSWSRSHEQLLHCGLRKFRHSKSSVYRWYTQLDRRWFVYDTFKTMKATPTHHSWVHIFITRRPTLTLQLRNFHFFVQVVSALLHGNWQDFNWHDASRRPSAIAELRVCCSDCFCILSLLVTRASCH